MAKWEGAMPGMGMGPVHGGDNTGGVSLEDLTSQVLQLGVVLFTNLAPLLF